MTDETGGIGAEEAETSVPPEAEPAGVPTAVRGRPARRGRGPARFEVTVALPHEAAIVRLTSALKAQGFGVLTRVELHTVLREKLGVTLRPYSLVGVCHPRLAQRAIALRPEAGLLLPCPVTVEAGPRGGSVIRIADPRALLAGMDLDGDAELMELATETRGKLRRVADELTHHPTLSII